MTGDAVATGARVEVVVLVVEGLGFAEVVGIGAVVGTAVDGAAVVWVAELKAGTAVLALPPPVLGFATGH